LYIFGRIAIIYNNAIKEFKALVLLTTAGKYIVLIINFPYPENLLRVFETYYVSILTGTIIIYLYLEGMYEE